MIGQFHGYPSFYEHFVNEENVEKIKNQKDVFKIIISAWFIVIFLSVSIGCSLAFMSLKTIDVLNVAFYAISPMYFLLALYPYFNFARKSSYYGIFKKKSFAYLLPLPFIFLTFLILALSVYNMIIIHSGHSEMLFPYSLQISIALFIIFITCIAFYNSAFLNYLIDYHGKAVSASQKSIQK